MDRIVVVGAGIGGLTAAALLAKAGADVAVLEAHVYPGGCAGTFYHRGVRFDAGATLAAGFDAAGGMTRLGETLGIAWPVEPAEAAMTVHLPDGAVVTRWVDPDRWQAERLAAFGPSAEEFWRWQEATADRLWDAALRGVPWPPQSGADLIALANAGLRMASAAPLRLPGLGLDAFRPVSAHLAGASEALRHYVDGQLLISAQATSAHANALYGAAALDMPRRGVAHVRGGMGKIAETLADAVRRHGGQVHYRQRVTGMKRRADGSYVVETGKKASFAAHAVVFNLPPWDAVDLLGEARPMGLRQAQPARDGRGLGLSKPPEDGWGAFMVYVGLAGVAAPPTAPLHQQVLVREPFGEGHSVFLSLSLPGDAARAPQGQRALTISTHTRLEPWWRLFEGDRDAYEARKQEYTDRVLAAAEVALPRVRSATSLVMPGTPVSFRRFTHRSLGWVGGFPQTSLLRAFGPRLGRNLWLVGDSVFPGQSVLAVALGGQRVARAVLDSASREPARRRNPESPHQETGLR